MAVKSILEIDLRDDKFRDFVKMFNGYERALKNQPAAWQAVNAKIQGTRSSFDKLVDTMAAANVSAKLREKAQERANQLTTTYAERWGKIARSTKEVAVNIGVATTSLLRWGAITGVISGLVGAGGLFGIDRLALGVAAGRRSSFGLGLPYGAQRAFGANFSRLVDPDAFLRGVAEAKMDVTKRVGLIGAGLTPGEINADTGTTAVSLLRALKRIADTTNPQFYGQVIAARRLQATPEELLRLRNTSPEEFQQLVGRFRGDVGAFGLPRDVARQWQEFTTQMARAGQGIENTFVRGLAPLAPGLSKLSESVTKVIGAFLGSPALKKWIGDVDKGLEKFAGYIGTEDFQKNVKDFVVNVGVLAKEIGTAVNWIAGFFKGSAPIDPATVVPSQRGLRGEVPKTVGDAKFNGWMHYLFGYGAKPINNPGNLRPPGASSGFQQFPTPEQGLLAMAHQLRLYARRGNDTISGIVSKYAPSSENNTAAYIADVSRRTGFAPGQHLDLSNNQTMAALLSAMVRHEQRPGSYDRYKDAKVTVEVLNRAGGDTAISVNALKN